MTSLTFYGGVKEIGGNKILLQDGDTKIFLDFGMSFGKRGKFFEEFLTPRTAAGINDFYDYHKKNRDDILEILKKKFNDENKINEYANLIINNSKQYKEDLIKLGIEV